MTDQAAQYGGGTMDAYVESMVGKWNERSPELFQSIALTMEENCRRTRHRISCRTWMYGEPPPPTPTWKGGCRRTSRCSTEFAGSLQQALAMDEGTLDEDEIGRIRDAVAQMVDAAVDLGQVDISAIMEAIPGCGRHEEQVRRLAEAYTNLAVVQHQSAEATAELEYINTKYDAMLGPLQRRLEALRASQETNTLDEEIAGQQHVIDNIYATDAQREAARLKLGAGRSAANQYAGGGEDSADKSDSGCHRLPGSTESGGAEGA